MSSFPPALPEPAADPAHTDTPLLHRALLRWAARLVLVMLAAAASLLLIAWLALHWAILPHIQQWREPIETRASQALGVPVRIGQIEVRSSGWVPSLELRDVVVLDAEKRPALSLPRIFAAISPRSLLSLELRFEQLLIDGAQLELRRDPQGRFFVAGLDVSGDYSGDGNAIADWFFKQHEFVIRGGSLRWTDEQREAPPLVLSDVQLVIRNGLLQHNIHLDATPPPEWGDRFTVSARFTQPLLARRGDWRRWSGSAYASLPRADLHALRQHVALPFELSEGVGALRGWFELKDGQPQAATVDLALRSVELRLAQTVDALAFEQVEGRLVAQRNAEGGVLDVQRLSFLTGDGVRWPQGDMKLAWRQREGEAATGGEFSAQRLDVGQMAQVASRIPLGDALRRLLDELQPQGVITELAAKWDGPLDAPEHYRVKGVLSGLALASKPSAEPKGVGRPGLRNATLQLSATELGGEARIGMKGGVLELPGVFDDPLLPLDQLSAQLAWKIEPAKAGAANPLPQVSVTVKDVRFSNPDAQGELSGSWRTGPGTGLARGGRYPGKLELDGRLTNGVVTRAWRYLPLDISKATRGYIEHAIQGGRLASASFRVKGDLSDFPFYNARSSAEGEFRIAAKVEDASFAYVPNEPASGATPAWASPWPMLTRANAELVVDRGTLSIRNGRAQIGKVEWSGVQGAIRHLEGDGVLGLEASAQGPLAEMLQFVNHTPVGGWIGHALDSGSAAGVADLKLDLSIPLVDTPAAQVKGILVLPGNDVRITPDSPLLAGAKGRVAFTHKDFSVAGASARLFGGELAFDGGLQPDGSIRFSGQGSASAEGLRRATDLGQAARVAGALSGQAAYRMNLGFAQGRPELLVTSNLVGLAINLPAPLNKSAEAPLFLRYQTALEPGTAAPALRDSLHVELGTLLQAHYLRDVSGEVPRVLRGGVGVMEPAPQPAAGVAANVNLKTLNTDEWDAAAERLFGNAEAREAAGAGGYRPDTLALRVQELNVGTRHLTRLVAGVSLDAGLWRANLDADQLNGYVEYRPPARTGTAAAGRVFARLSRLSLPRGEVDQVESLLDQQPATLPALDIVVDDFELRGKRLGRLEIEAVNRSSGQGRDVLRDWQLSKFNITTPEAQLVATGHWAALAAPPARGTPAPRRAVMDFTLELADSGAFLDRLGTAKAIRGGKGQLSGQVSWLGSPFSLDYPSLAGQISVAIDAGQFLKVDPGATRLLSVLSLQSLPRRLLLDFRDVFQEGFAFDNIAGDVKITQGVAQTNNLRMRGVQAAVLMEGRADIARETQDLRVVVVPEINAGTAALAYAVINPAIGLGAFLAQVLLRKPLSEAGTREFHVSGPWADPKVEPVARAASASATPPKPQ
ncbi:MAG: YhdP family protein [Burkholderiales bacterium]|nr:YhdP family protein [Burkholderiales bacterium]